MRHWLVFFLLCVVVCSAGAEIMVGESLEWLTDSSPQVAVFKVMTVERDNTSEAKFTDATVKIQRGQVLKGNPPERASYRASICLSARPGEAGCEPARGEQTLAFFRDGKIYRTLSLDHPLTRGEGAALSADFQVLTTGKAVLEGVQCQLGRKPAQRSKRIEVPVGTPAFEALYAGSACYLVIPLDP